ncbi:MAG TPA: AraC family transcriptional regulator [Bacteroidia bacterium]|jgi:AraC family transcriptional activator of pobA|nr:AraC family transcriptional regulator [Bacteroidia bacterium]
METKQNKKASEVKATHEAIPLFNSIAEFLHYVGINKHLETDFTINTLEDSFKGTLIKSNPFRANYFVFVFITEGAGTIMLDNEEYKVGPNSFYYTNPGHLRAITIDKSLKGFMMSTNEAFLKRYYKGDLFSEFPFLAYDVLPPVKVEGSLTHCFNMFLSSMLNTYACEQGVYRYHIINNLAITFLYKVKELFLTSSDALCKKYNGSPLVRRFMKVHDEEFRKLIKGQSENRITLKGLADLLHINPNYLGSVVKKGTGKSVSRWLHGKELAEAQALLLNTELSVSQIAGKLGFDEPSNFIKFFKKKMGRTPKDYRNQKSLNNN